MEPYRGSAIALDLFSSKVYLLGFWKRENSREAESRQYNLEVSFLNICMEIILLVFLVD